MVGKRRRRCSARICLRAVERETTDGGASEGIGVERPLARGVSTSAGEECGSGGCLTSSCLSRGHSLAVEDRPSHRRHCWSRTGGRAAGEAACGRADGKRDRHQRHLPPRSTTWLTARGSIWTRNGMLGLRRRGHGFEERDGGAGARATLFPSATGAARYGLLSLTKAHSPVDFSIGSQTRHRLQPRLASAPRQLSHRGEGRTTSPGPT